MMEIYFTPPETIDAPFICEMPSADEWKAVLDLVRKTNVMDVDTFKMEISMHNYNDDSLSRWAVHTLIDLKPYTSEQLKKIRDQRQKYIKNVSEISNNDHVYWKAREAAANLIRELEADLRIYKRSGGKQRTPCRDAAIWFLINGRKKPGLKAVKNILAAIDKNMTIKGLESFQSRHGTHYKLVG